MAVEAGADALGLVSEMPSGPGVIDESEIAKITQEIPFSVETFLLTSRLDAISIGRQFDEMGVTTLQLVDWVGVQNLVEIRERCPSARIVQVLHVESEVQIEEARSIESCVDAIRCLFLW